MIDRLRVVGALLAVASYLLMVNDMTVPGVAVNCAAQGTLTPFNVQHKAWDMCALAAFFTAVNVHRLLS